MTMMNRDVFSTDPTKRDIPNLGVSKVKTPEDARDWTTLEWELQSFVCEGAYEQGLDRILDQYLSHLSQAEQPAVWVSGFYGSGKSHLMRVLQYLWQDVHLPSGASARSLVHMTPDISQHLVELSTAAKRSGGLWSAAGTLGSGASGSVRLAFLSVIFDAAELPQQLAPAKLAVWLKEQGLYDAVRLSVEERGKVFDHELRNLYVSPVLAQALIAAGTTFGDTQAAVSTTLQNQFPTVDDISNDEMLDIFGRVLELQSNGTKKLPLTLVVLDEMQQYINDENSKALNVQELVEACSSRFGSKVLVVATGQSALSANPTLQKLIDRFSVTVALSDTDVEAVVRQVVLRKKPDAIGAIQETLEKVSGEIDRQLGGTRLEAKSADKTTLIADYPLLPTRRRFLERVLRALDKTGKAGVLRTQLKIVHEAARSVADKPLGFVIGADFVFRSESASMLQSGVLLKEIDELIRGLVDGSEDGELKSRVCALIFLISQLPTEGAGDTGVRSVPAAIADLLVEDLFSDGSRLRKEVPRVLEELVDEGRVVKLGDEFRLQTEEGAEWTKEFNQRRSVVRDDASRMSQLRNAWLHIAVDGELSGIRLDQGESKTPRKIERIWDETEPIVSNGAVPVWIRDEWSISESKARESALKAGNESPIVFVLLPKVDAETIRDVLAAYTAAQDTISQRPEPQTDQGRQAKQGMRSRLLEGERRLEVLFGAVIANARVFQGGGNDIQVSSLREGIEVASRNALARMFPKFGAADNPHWGKVAVKARDGAPDALSAVGWLDQVPANPVCKEVLARISGAGVPGAEVQRQLSDSPYGWPKDAIDGALIALLANGNVRAARDGKSFSSAKELPVTQIGKTTFFKEDEPPSVTERLAVKGLLAGAKVPYQSDQESAAISGLLQRLLTLASGAGGAPPLPEPPDTSVIDELLAMVGNQQFRAVAQKSEVLHFNIQEWNSIGESRGHREVEWEKLNRLLRHGDSIQEALAIRAQRDALLSGRLLLALPDPIAPLLEELCSLLRSAVLVEVSNVNATYEVEMERLEESQEWGRLEIGPRELILGDVGLVKWDLPVVATDDRLLESLDSVSLEAWSERRQALPAKAAAVRIAAAKKLEPKSVTVKLTSATIRTESDVNSYPEELRSELIKHVNAGETVII
jgi:hypothetical protein